MALDKRIETAIQEACKEAGYGDQLQERLVGWFEELATGNEQLDDRDSVVRHITNLFDAIPVKLKG